MREHSREHASQAQLANAIVKGIANSGSRNADLKSAAAGLGAKLFVELPFSREMELEADVMGLELMARAGYDPQLALSFWQKMQSVSTQQSSYDFLRTHPNNDRRIGELTAAMPKVAAFYKPQSAEPQKQSSPVSVVASRSANDGPAIAATSASTSVAFVAEPKSVGPMSLVATAGAGASRGLPAFGQESYQVERVAKRESCNADPRATLTAKGPGFEAYTVPCSNGDALIFRCEFGNCRILK